MLGNVKQAFTLGFQGETLLDQGGNLGLDWQVCATISCYSGALFGIRRALSALQFPRLLPRGKLRRAQAVAGNDSRMQPLDLILDHFDKVLRVTTICDMNNVANRRELSRILP